MSTLTHPCYEKHGHASASSGGCLSAGGGFCCNRLDGAVLTGGDNLIGGSQGQGAVLILGQGAVYGAAYLDGQLGD